MNTIKPHDWAKAIKFLHWRNLNDGTKRYLKIKKWCTENQKDGMKKNNEKTPKNTFEDSLFYAE